MWASIAFGSNIDNPARTYLARRDSARSRQFSDSSVTDVHSLSGLGDTNLRHMHNYTGIGTIVQWYVPSDFDTSDNPPNDPGRRSNLRAHTVAQYSHPNTCAAYGLMRA